MRASIANYRQNDLAGAEALAEGNPHRRVALLLDGFLERMDLAGSCIRHGDVARKAKALNSASNILVALRSSLDHKLGGDISAGLDALYEYGIFRLLQANIKNDPLVIEEVRSLIAKVSSAWNAIPSTNVGAA